MEPLTVRSLASTDGVTVVAQTTQLAHAVAIQLPASLRDGPPGSLDGGGGSVNPCTKTTAPICAAFAAISISDPPDVVSHPTFLPSFLPSNSFHRSFVRKALESSPSLSLVQTIQTLHSPRKFCTLDINNASSRASSQFKITQNQERLIRGFFASAGYFVHKDNLRLLIHPKIISKMQFSKFIVAAAAFSVAQALVQFTNPSFNSVTAGQPFNITWSGASGAVTLTLKDGPSTALVTVNQIASK